jgi:hypothetical protein
VSSHDSPCLKKALWRQITWLNQKHPGWLPAAGGAASLRSAALCREFAVPSRGLIALYEGQETSDMGELVRSNLVFLIARS